MLFCCRKRGAWVDELLLFVTHNISIKVRHLKHLTVNFPTSDSGTGCLKRTFGHQAMEIFQSCDKNRRFLTAEMRAELSKLRSSSVVCLLQKSNTCCCAHAPLRLIILDGEINSFYETRAAGKFIAPICSREFTPSRGSLITLIC